MEALDTLSLSWMPLQHLVVLVTVKACALQDISAPHASYYADARQWQGRDVIGEDSPEPKVPCGGELNQLSYEWAAFGHSPDGFPFLPPLNKCHAMLSSSTHLRPTL